MSDIDLGNLWERTCRETVSAPPLSGTANADLVIVGGGYTGCAAALFAAKAGADVRLVEAHDISHGGSGRNVGLVNAGLWLAPDAIARIVGSGTAGKDAGERLISLLDGAPQRVFGLIEEHGIDCEPVRNGTLHCAHSSSGLAGLGERHRQLAARGAPVRLLDAGETARRTGTMLYCGALHDARAGTIQPLAYCRGLARAAQDAGAKLHTRSPAIAILRDKGTWRVETVAGNITAKSLLLATNAYHAFVAGIASPQFVTMNYFNLATGPLTDAQRAGILSGGEGCWDTGMVMSSFRLDAAGRLIVGSFGDLDGPGRAIHTDWARRKLSRWFPQLGSPEIEDAWSGRIAMTGDHVPKIVALGENGYACFGYSGRGIGPGTTFGTLAAEALLSGDPGRLPLPPVGVYAESLKAAKAAFYEFGAIATHAFAAR